MDSDPEADIDGNDTSSKRDFLKLERNLQTSGFREGAGAGQDGAFQSGFDAGYAEGFKTAFSLGKFNGVVETLKRNAELLSLNEQELDSFSFENSRFGLCQICKDSADKSPCNCKKSQDITTISARQAEITKKALTEKMSISLPIFEKTGLNELIAHDSE